MKAASSASVIASEVKESSSSLPPSPLHDPSPRNSVPTSKSQQSSGKKVIPLASDQSFQAKAQGFTGSKQEENVASYADFDPSVTHLPHSHFSASHRGMASNLRSNSNRNSQIIRESFEI